MAQKVIDIRHPSSRREEDNTPLKKRKWGLPLLLIVLLIFSGIYFKLYRVDVEIWPTTEDFYFSEVVGVHAFSNNEIAVQAFEETVEGGRDFEVLGRSLVEEKTEGVISVCQDYSDAVQPIREGTRFVCEKGKLFIGKDAFTIPGRKHEDGKTVSGCVDVAVIAAEAGEDYNIPSNSKFSLPGLQGTALYGRFFGESFTITKEGKSDEVAFLTSEEISKAEDILLNELFERGKISLMDRLSDQFMMDSRAQYNRVIIERSSPTEGEKSSFRIDMKVEVEVIAVNSNSAREFLKSSLPEGYTWYNESIDYDFLRANFAEKTGEMEISLDTQVYKEMDIEKLKRDIAGVSFSEVVDELEGRDEIEKVSLKFYPIGPSFVPRSTKRINIELLFDKN